MSDTAELLRQIASDPARLEIFVRVLDNPKCSLEALDELIRSPRTTPDARERWKSLREALEAYALETKA